MWLIKLWEVIRIIISFDVEIDRNDYEGGQRRFVTDELLLRGKSTLPHQNAASIFTILYMIFFVAVAADAFRFFFSICCLVIREGGNASVPHIS